MKRFLAIISIVMLLFPVVSQDIGVSSLGNTQVDYLTFGIRTLENELRLKRLEVCAESDCRAEKVSHSTRFEANRPEWWPDNTPWPETGAVIISSVQERSGSDSSMTSESGCKVAAGQLRFSDEYGLARLSVGRFFVPDADWRQLQRIDEDNLTAKKMLSVVKSTYIIQTVRHEWIRPNGATDRAIWITCFGPLLKAMGEIAVIRQGHYP
jgi:hypothetical protein